MASWGKQTATVPGQTGNNTHPSVDIPADFDQLAFVFVVEAVGTTVTFKWQVSFSGQEVSDANSVWSDLAYVLQGAAEDAAETFVTTTQTVTAPGRTVELAYIGSKVGAIPRKARLVTTANTGVTYSGEILGRDTE